MSRVLRLKADRPLLSQGLASEMVSRLVLTIACLGLAAGVMRCRYPKAPRAPKFDPNRSEECNECIANAIRMDDEVTRMREQGVKDLYSPFACPLMQGVDQYLCRATIERVQLSHSLDDFDPVRVCTKSGICPGRPRKDPESSGLEERGGAPAPPGGLQGRKRPGRHPLDIVFCQKHKKVY